MPVAFDTSLGLRSFCHVRTNSASLIFSRSHLCFAPCLGGFLGINRPALKDHAVLEHEVNGMRQCTIAALMQIGAIELVPGRIPNLLVLVLYPPRHGEAVVPTPITVVSPIFLVFTFT